MNRRTLDRRFFKVPALAVAIACTAFAGSALASGSGNSIHVSVPGHVRVGVQYSVTIKGHAAKSEALYMFVDYFKCASTPAGEHHRANGDIWAVHGSFKKVSSGWNSPKTGADHVCAYLVKASAPRNPSSGVLAHKFLTYTVH